MNRASELPIVESSLEVYEDLRASLEKMRQRTSRLSDLLAIASIADEIGTRIRGLRVKRNKLSAVISIAVRA